MTKKLLHKKDVAAIVGRQVRTIDRWISEGFFPQGKRIKGYQTWTQKDVDTWLNKLPADMSRRLSV